MVSTVLSCILNFPINARIVNVRWLALKCVECILNLELSFCAFLGHPMSLSEYFTFRHLFGKAFFHSLSVFHNDWSHVRSIWSFMMNLEHHNLLSLHNKTGLVL